MKNGIKYMGKNTGAFFNNFCMNTIWSCSFTDIQLFNKDFYIASQLWSPYLLKHVYLIEKVQRAFTKHISGMCFLSYSKRLEVLKLYSLQRRRERYGIIYVWKMIEGLVPKVAGDLDRGRFRPRLGGGKRGVRMSFFYGLRIVGCVGRGLIDVLFCQSHKC